MQPSKAFELRLEPATLMLFLTDGAHNLSLKLLRT